MTEFLKHEDLAGMSAEEIRAATLDGRMDAILGVRKAPAVTLDPAEVDRLSGDPDALAKYVAKARAEADYTKVGSAAWLKTASPKEITEALNRGELDDLLAGRGPHYG